MKPILACVLLVACSKSNAHPTAAGATIVSWELAQSDRTTIRAAQLSNTVAKDLDYEAHPTTDTTVKVKVHLETASAVYTEDNTQVTHNAPVKLAVTVVDAGDFTLTGGKCMGPHYELAKPGEAPLNMILHCVVKATKPSYDVGFTLYAYGDGRIDDGSPKTTQTIHVP